MKNIFILTAFLLTNLIKANEEVKIFESIQSIDTYSLGGDQNQTLFSIKSKQIIFKQGNDDCFIVNQYLTKQVFDFRFFNQCQNDFLKGCYNLELLESSNYDKYDLQIDPFINRLHRKGMALHGKYFLYKQPPNKVYDFSHLKLYPYAVTPITLGNDLIAVACNDIEENHYLYIINSNTKEAVKVLPMAILEKSDHWKPFLLEWVSPDYLSASFHYGRDSYAGLKFLRLVKNKAIEENETIFLKWSRFIFSNDIMHVIDSEGKESAIKIQHKK